MRLWAYYAGHTFVNSIKKIFRSKVIATIILVIVFAMMFGFIGGIVGSTIENQIDSNQQVEESVEEQEKLDEIEAAVEEKIDMAVVQKAVYAGVFALTTIIVLWGIYTGTKKGSDIFLMADVNLLFTAPMKPQSVLLFRLTFQMLAVLVGSIYIFFQIPNLMINLNLGIEEVMIVVFAYLLLIVIQRIISVFSYTFVSTHEKMKDYVFPFIIGVAVFLSAWVGIAFLSNGKDVMATLDATLCHPFVKYIPLIGWFCEMVQCVFTGEYLTALIYMGVTLLTIVVFTYIIWHLKADFYEDAMAGAQKREEVLLAAKEGRKTATKERSKRIQRNMELKGEGASVFLTKAVYNRRRFAKFGIVSNMMLLYAGIAAIVCVFCIKALEIYSFAAVALILGFVLYFRNMGNPIAEETKMNWLFLVPENPFKKVFFAMMAGTYETAMDLLPVFVVVGIVMKESPFVVVAWLIALLTMDFMLSGLGMLLEALLPASAMDVVKSMIQMIFKMLALLAIVISYLVGWLLLGECFAIGINVVINVIGGGILFLLYPSLLHKGVQ